MRKPNFKILPLILAMNSQYVMAGGTANVIDDAAIASIASMITSQTSLEHLSIDLSNANLSSANVVLLAAAIADSPTLKEVSMDLSGNINVDDAAVFALSSALKDSLKQVKIGLDGTSVTDSGLKAISTKMHPLPKEATINFKIPTNSSAANDANALKKIFDSPNALEQNTDNSGIFNSIYTSGFPNDLLTSTLNYTVAREKDPDIVPIPPSQITTSVKSVSISSVVGNSEDQNSLIVIPGGAAENVIPSANTQNAVYLLKKLTTIHTLTSNLRDGDGKKTGNKSGASEPSKLISEMISIDSSTTTDILKSLENLIKLKKSIYPLILYLCINRNTLN